MGWVRKGGTAQYEAGFFARSMEMSRRARIGAQNPFVSIGIPTADLRFYPAAPVVPFQGNIGSGIGFAAGPARALDEDDGCGVGAVLGGWNSCGETLLSPPLRSWWTG